MNECITWSIWDNEFNKYGKDPRVNLTHWPTDLHESCTGVQDALIDRQLHPRHVLPGLMQHLLLHKDKQSITTVIKSQIQQSFISSSIVLKKNYFDRWYSLSTQCQLQIWVHYQICLLEKESCNVVYQYLSRIICLAVLGNWGFFVGVVFFSILEFVFWGILTYQRDKYFPVF